MNRLAVLVLDPLLQTVCALLIALFQAIRPWYICQPGSVMLLHEAEYACSLCHSLCIECQGAISYCTVYFDDATLNADSCTYSSNSSIVGTACVCSSGYFRVNNGLTVTCDQCNWACSGRDTSGDHSTAFETGVLKIRNTCECLPNFTLTCLCKWDSG